jgi:nanoRNase/pAp phosphatase (c-di-AMP/oligoRNAs hydrolase)
MAEVKASPSNGKIASNKSAQKVKKLNDVLRDKRSLLIVMQDNPDPDSIASAAALRRIANTVGEVQCSITYGGVIGRGENKALADYLNLNFRSVEQIDFEKFDAIALVDTQPKTGNNSLPEEIQPDIVLDHHDLRPATRGVSFTDVRSKYGALSTILFEYLTEAEISPAPPLATALLYAIRTDTQDLGLEAVRADVRALEALYPLANARMLSMIQRGSVTAPYYQNLAKALKNARTQGPCIIAALNGIHTPDILGEAADMFLRCEGVEWTLCSGTHQGKLWISLRTSQNKIKAKEVMQKLVFRLGTGGGHETSAGGQVVLAKDTRQERESLQKTIRDRLFHEIGVSKQQPRKLVDI